MEEEEGEKEEESALHLFFGGGVGSSIPRERRKKALCLFACHFLILLRVPKVDEYYLALGAQAKKTLSLFSPSAVLRASTQHCKRE